MTLDDAEGDEAAAAPRPGAAARARWAWTPALHAPEAEGGDQSTRAAPSRAAPSRAAPSWAGLGRSDAEAFEAWCTGRTGAPLVDAGMLQLWACGWMPRRIRLLCASCLVEGMGLDWRLGRDWFAYALIDHDPFINACMWQNAGLCGVDPFYRGLRWDIVPNGENDEYVQPAPPPTTASMIAPTTAPSAARRPPPADDESSGYVGSNSYSRVWLALAPSELPPWPPALRAATRRPRPPIERVQEAAAARRAHLKRAYQLGGRISRVGVRVPISPLAKPTDEGAAAGEELAGARVSDLAAPASEERIVVGHMSFRVPPIEHSAKSAKRR